MVDKNMYDNVRTALEDLQDANVLERVAFYVLRPKYPDLRITSATGDGGIDAYVRRLFDHTVDLRVMVSLEGTWTSKLDREIKKIQAQEPTERAPRALFLTTSVASENGKTPRVETASKLGVNLEIVDLTILVSELETDELHWVAEVELGVRPRVPRALIGPDEFVAQMGRVIPGFDADLVGRSAELESIAAGIADTGRGAPRVIVVCGTGGLGKSRVAVEAARHSATTLIAMAGVPVDRAALSEVPLQSPAVILVDDAHRCPDLSGIAAMLGDSRYNGVKVVLTVRPGLADLALEQAGLEAHPRVDVSWDLLGRPEMATLVRGQGIDDDGFIVSVIDIAQGNPLLAHLACEIALSNGRFDVHNVTDVLKRGVSQRLARLSGDGRAVAVALALAGPVHGGAELARLHSVVRRLPADYADLDRQLDDIADAGLATVTPPAEGRAAVYTLRPELLAPVLVAEALQPGDRNAINTTAALAAVGSGHPISKLGMLGLPPVTSHATGFDAARVAPRLAVLAQAAHLADDRILAKHLGQGVLQLLPEPATTAAWRVVVTLAGQVAPVAPGLFADLRTALSRQWPLPPVPPSPYFEDADRMRVLDLQQLVHDIEGMVSRTAAAAPAEAIRLLLTCAALALPLVDHGGRNPALEATRALTRWGGGRTVTADEVLADREVTLQAVRTWLGSDTAGMQPAAASHVAFRAVTPLIKPLAEMQWMGTADTADVVVMSSGWLPPGPRTRTACRAAAEVAAELIAALDPADPAASLMLAEAVRLPAELLAEGRRGLPNSDAATPSHVTEILAESAERIRAVVAERWSELPLGARHAALAAESDYGPRPRTVAQRAEYGDPVAIAAATDPEVQNLVVLAAVDRHWRGSARDPDWAQHVHEREAAATALAATLDWDNAIRLLQVADEHRTADLADHEARTAFAAELGRLAGRRGQGRVLLESVAKLSERVWTRALVLGTLEADPSVKRDLMGRRAQPSAALLALSISNDVDPQTRRTILDAAHLAVTAPTRTRSRSVRRAYDVLRRLVARQASTSSDDRTVELAQQLARILMRGPDPAPERMDRLLALGEVAPAAVVPEILRLATYSIRTEERRSRTASAPAADDDLVTASPAQAAALVRVLARVLDAAPSKYDLGGDIALAVAALAVAVPEELADDLARRLAGPSFDGRWPLGWDHHLREVAPAARAPFVSALRCDLDAILTTHPVNPVTRFDIDRAVAAIAAGTDAWAEDVTAWAAGNEAQRARAVSSIARAWRHPIWPAVVAQLLTRGIDDRQRAELHHGIQISSFGPDLARKAGQPRLAALDALEATSQDPAVTRFAEEARHRVTSDVDGYQRDAQLRRQGYGFSAGRSAN